MQQLRRCAVQSFGLMKQTRNFAYKVIKRPTLVGKSDLTKTVPTQSGQNVSLSKVLTTLINGTGPISIAEYMKHVLTNPYSGYYMLKDVFGEKGDFITSPEINQIFGESIAVWCLSQWQNCGFPDPFQIVELGPGRGTLSWDIIRTLAELGFSKNFSLHLVEISPYMSDLQAKRLCANYSESIDSDSVPHYRTGTTLSGIEVYWYRSVDKIPKSFSIFLAHEFFDALPIHQFQKKDNAWHEILIDVDREKSDSFRFVTSNAMTPMLGMFLTRPWMDKIQLNDHVEYSKDMEQIVETIAVHMEEYGGFGLIMDYGHCGEKQNTFRSFKNHSLHDPLVEPGTADLTADVNFAHIKAIAENEDRLISFGPVEQKDFLRRMGGELRLEALVDNATSENNVESLKTGYQMLTDPSQMGSRFKMFAIFPKVLENHLKNVPVVGFYEYQKPE